MQLATERLDVNVPSPVKGAEAVALREQRCVMGIRQPTEVPKGAGSSAHSRLNTTREEPSK